VFFFFVCWYFIGRVGFCQGFLLGFVGFFVGLLVSGLFVCGGYPPQIRSPTTNPRPPTPQRRGSRLYLKEKPAFFDSDVPPPITPTTHPSKKVAGLPNGKPAFFCCG